MSLGPPRTLVPFERVSPGLYSIEGREFQVAVVNRELVACIEGVWYPLNDAAELVQTNVLSQMRIECEEDAFGEQ